MPGYAASLALLSIAGVSVAFPADAGPEQNKAQVLRSVLELWSGGNLQVANALYAPEFVCHNLVGPDWRGVGGITAAIEQHRAAFPDWQERVDDIVAEGDRVAIRFTATGTHRGTFAGIPATGRKVTIGEVSFYRFAAGRIVERWGMPDVNGMLTQLRSAR